MKRLRALPSVSEVKLESDREISYRAAEPDRVNPEIVRLAVAEGADVLGSEPAPDRWKRRI